MTTHTDCTHPATKAARAACRRTRTAETLAGDAVARVAVAKAQAETPAAPRRIAKVEWDRETCTRCGGTGRYPSAMWQGVCLGCNGLGRKLTRAGKAALAKYDAYMAANHSKMMIDLQPGDVVRDQHGRRRTVVSVDPEIRHNGTCAIGVEGTDSYVISSSLTILVNYKREAHYVGPFDTIAVPPKGEALQAAFRHVANMKGALIEYAD